MQSEQQKRVDRVKSELIYKLYSRIPLLMDSQKFMMMELLKLQMNPCKKDIDSHRKQMEKIMKDIKIIEDCIKYTELDASKITDSDIPVLLTIPTIPVEGIDYTEDICNVLAFLKGLDKHIESIDESEESSPPPPSAAPAPSASAGSSAK